MDKDQKVQADRLGGPYYPVPPEVIKGDKGDKGDDGDQGPPGPSIALASNSDGTFEASGSLVVDNTDGTYTLSVG